MVIAMLDRPEQAAEVRAVFLVDEGLGELFVRHPLDQRSKLLRIRLGLV